MKIIKQLIVYLCKKMGLAVYRDFKVPDGNLNLFALGVRALNKTQLTVVQIGAFDGELCDPLRNLLTYPHLRVLFVEPQPEAFRKLKLLYTGRPGTLFENSAIGDFDGTAKMYLEKNTLSSPLASLDRNHLTRFGIDPSEASSINVQVIRVESLLKRHQIEQVDVLQVDTEGFDYKIVTQFLESGFVPKIINFERLHLDKKERVEILRRLEQHHYCFQDHGYDTFAIQRELLN